MLTQWKRNNFSRPVSTQSPSQCKHPPPKHGHLTMACWWSIVLPSNLFDERRELGFSPWQLSYGLEVHPSDVEWVSCATVLDKGCPFCCSWPQWHQHHLRSGIWQKNMIHTQNRFNHKTEKKGWTNKTSYLHSTWLKGMKHLMSLKVSLCEGCMNKVIFFSAS